MACFITYAIWPHQITFIGIYFSLGKRNEPVLSVLWPLADYRLQSIPEQLISKSQ